MSNVESIYSFNYRSNDVGNIQRTIDGGEVITDYNSTMYRNNRYGGHAKIGGRDEYNYEDDYQQPRFSGPNSSRDIYRGMVSDDGYLDDRGGGGGGGNYNYHDNYRGDYPPPPAARSTQYYDSSQESGNYQRYPHHPHQRPARGYENDRPNYHPHHPYKESAVRVDNRNGYYSRDVDDDYYADDHHDNYHNRNIHSNVNHPRSMNARQGHPYSRNNEEERFYKSDPSQAYPTIQEIQNVENPVESYDEYPTESGRHNYGVKQDERNRGGNNRVLKQDPSYRQYDQDQENNVPFKTVQSVMPGDAYSQSIERKLRENDKASSSGSGAGGGGGGGGYTSSSSGKPTAQHASMLEIAPGVYARLRTAQETMEAISRDFYIPSECFCCNLTIFCIQDADYVLCPECRVISRNGDGGGDFDEYEDGGGDKKKSAAGGGKDGGVGLGFTLDELAEWQADAERRMATTSNNSGAHHDRYNRSYRY